MLTRPTFDMLLRHTANGYPLEACGLLIGRRAEGRLWVTRALPCPNAARPAERPHRFMIEPRAVLNVRRALRGTGQSIVGFYHSHPDEEARLSARDLEFLRLWPETAWVIVPVRRAAPQPPRAWWLDEAEGAAPRELVLNTAAGEAVAAECPD